MGERDSNHGDGSQLANHRIESGPVDSTVDQSPHPKDLPTTTEDQVETKPITPTIGIERSEQLERNRQSSQYDNNGVVDDMTVKKLVDIANVRDLTFEEICEASNPVEYARVSKKCDKFGERDVWPCREHLTLLAESYIYLLNQQGTPVPDKEYKYIRSEKAWWTIINMISTSAHFATIGFSVSVTAGYLISNTLSIDNKFIPLTLLAFVFGPMLTAMNIGVTYIQKNAVIFELLARANNKLKETLPK